MGNYSKREQHGKILIVDDNKDIAGMLSKYLVMKGQECTTSKEGINTALKKTCGDKRTFNNNTKLRQQI